jgi:hypothetical protein
LNRTQVSDSGLVHLEGLTALQTLNLGDTHVSNVGLTELRAARTNCAILGP